MERKCLNYSKGDNCTDSYEKCAKQIVCPPTRHHCFVVWELDNATTPSSPKVVSGGCIQYYTGTECDTECVGKPRGSRIFYCCCASDLCNMRFITPQALTIEQPIERLHQNEHDDLNQNHHTPSNVLWIIIPILLIVILVSIYIYWYRRGKSTRGLHSMIKNNSNSNRRNKGVTSNLNDRELTELRNNNDISLIVPFRNQFGNEHFFNNNNNNNNNHPSDHNNYTSNNNVSNLSKSNNDNRASSMTNNHEATNTMQSGSRIDLQSIKLLEVIGSGRFGTVHRALVDNKTDNEVAVKIISSSEQQSWLNETQIYSTPRVKHPNILKFFHSEENLNRENYWLIVEYAAKGSLHSFLKDNVVNWKEFLYIALGIVHGLSHLHEADIAHRDFKSKNILLKEDLTPCITDFGVAVILDSSTGSQLDQRKKYLQVGTPRYMAPEVLECSVTFTKASFTKIDVYALSLVLWELLTRCYPLPESAQHRFDLNYQDYLLENSNYPSNDMQQQQQQHSSPNSSQDETNKQVTNSHSQDVPQDNGCEPPPYKLPFEDVAGSNPDIIKMRQIVVVDKLRPAIRDEWRTYPASEFCRAIEDGWEYDHDARISASCFVERVESLPKS